MLCSIVPPHILRNIVERGDVEDRARALVALAWSQTPRRERQALAQIAGRPAVARAQKRRTVHDAEGLRVLPGVIARTDGSRRSRDVAVNEAWEGSGTTWDFFKKVHGRNSIDGRGMKLVSTVHYGTLFNNAQWNGRQMIYGDGDGKYFHRFTSSIEVIAHELTHGITQYTASLGFSGQTGALAEHFSDVFGVLVRQYTRNHTAAKADWLIGAQLFTDRVQGAAIRSMKEPGNAYDDPVLGRDPQPAHMRDYQNKREDDGGVHVNSGIPNHAFYRTATLLGGRAWEVAGRIWYEALTRHLHARARFQQCVNATWVAASDLYGAASEPADAVIEGWRGVGLEVSASVLERPRRQKIREQETFEAPAPAAWLPELA